MNTYKIEDTWTITKRGEAYSELAKRGLAIAKTIGSEMAARVDDPYYDEVSGEDVGRMKRYVTTLQQLADKMGLYVETEP